MGAVCAYIPGARGGVSSSLLWGEKVVAAFSGSLGQRSSEVGAMKAFTRVGDVGVRRAGVFRSRGGQLENDGGRTGGEILGRGGGGGGRG